MGHLGDHQHEYGTVREGLSPWQMVKLTYKIQCSDRYNIGDFSHIHLTDTNICVGYLGDDSAQLVDPERRDIKPLHRQLRRIFNSV